MWKLILTGAASLAASPTYAGYGRSARSDIILGSGRRPAKGAPKGPTNKRAKVKAARKASKRGKR